MIMFYNLSEGPENIPCVHVPAKNIVVYHIRFSSCSFFPAPCHATTWLCLALA